MRSMFRVLGIYNFECGINFFQELFRLNKLILRKTFQLQRGSVIHARIFSGFYKVCSYYCNSYTMGSNCLLSRSCCFVTKVFIEMSLGGIFLWNRNWDLGWIWANWQYWKKVCGPIMSNFWGCFFSYFQGQKNDLKKIHCRVCTKKLHKMKFKKYFVFGIFFFAYFL